MDTISTVIAVCLVCFGTFFSIIAVLGYFRLPDVFSRLHTTGKVGVFGVVFFLTAAALTAKGAWGYALVLIFFLLASSPVASHAIASTAFRMGLRPKNAVQDDLSRIQADQDQGPQPRNPRS